MDFPRDLHVEAPSIFIYLFILQHLKNHFISKMLLMFVLLCSRWTRPTQTQLVLWPQDVDWRHIYWLKHLSDLHFQIKRSLTRLTPMPQILNLHWPDWEVISKHLFKPGPVQREKVRGRWWPTASSHLPVCSLLFFGDASPSSYAHQVHICCWSLGSIADWFCPEGQYSFS